jgi:hypothetical protein
MIGVPVCPRCWTPLRISSDNGEWVCTETTCVGGYPCPTHYIITAEQVAAIEAEVERLRGERDLAREHVQQVARQGNAAVYEAEGLREAVRWVVDAKKAATFGVAPPELRKAIDAAAELLREGGGA